jgi:SNF2 family DNA or RNA helicase
MKKDVELSLPPRHERIVCVSLTSDQELYYKAVVDKTLRYTSKCLPPTLLTPPL